MIAKIVDYFTYLATQHPALLHSDVSGQRVVEVASLEEAFGDVRTGARPQGPLLRLVLPTSTLSDLNDGAYKQYQWGLMVLRWHGADPTPAQMVAAIGAAETIADDLLARLISDARAGHPLLKFGPRSANALGMAGEVVERMADGTYSGVLYTFNIMEALGLRSTPSSECAPVAWLDGGLTPSNVP